MEQGEENFLGSRNSGLIGGVRIHELIYVAGVGAEEKELVVASSESMNKDG